MRRRPVSLFPPETIVDEASGGLTGVRTRTVSANGLDFHVLEAGSGPLVLCLHGFPDHARPFVPLLRRLAAAGYRAVAPNMRGFWPTDPAPDGCYQGWATGGDAVALVTALGEPRAAALIGHDWGAVAAYAAVRTAPERFARLVALSVPDGGRLGAAMIGNPRQQKRSWYLYLFQMRFAEAALAADEFALVDRLWADWSPGYRLPAAERAALIAMFRRPGVLAALLACYRQAFDPTLSRAEWIERQAALRRPIGVPALYLHGSDDGCIGADVADGMADGFAVGLETAVIADAGHFLHLEQPDAVAHRIIAFLKGKA